MNKKRDERTTAQFIRDRLNGSDYDRGEVERANAQATNATNGLARLVEILHDKGVITDNDLETIGMAKYD